MGHDSCLFYLVIWRSIRYNCLEEDTSVGLTSR